jgi:hypothetical protein
MAGLGLELERRSLRFGEGVVISACGGGGGLWERRSVEREEVGHDEASHYRDLSEGLFMRGAGAVKPKAGGLRPLTPGGVAVPREFGRIGFGRVCE